MPGWKIAAIAGWFVVGIALFTAQDSQLIRYAKLGFWITLAAHVLEFAFFHKTLQKAPGGMGMHFVLTLALGMFHIQGVRAESEAERA